MANEQAAEIKTSSLAPKTMLEFTLKKNVFGEAPEENHFILATGGIIKDLKELAEALEGMNEETFRFHANESKNDFASWTKDIFKEEELAEKLLKANSKSEAHVAVLKHLVNKI